MKRKGWSMAGGVIICLLTVLSMPSASLAIGIEAAIGGWSQGISGDIAYRPINAITDTIDLETDMGYDDETRAMGRVRIDMPLVIPNIYLMYTPVEFEGSGRKNVNFKFGDYTFTGNVPYTSKVSLDHVDVALFYSIPFLNLVSLDTLNIDLGLNLKVADVEAQITQSVTGQHEDKSYTLPIPMAFAAIQVKPIDIISFEAEARGIAYSGNHLYNLIGRIKFKPLGPFFIAGGYRYDSIKLDEKDVLLDATIKGVFAETGLEF